MRKIKFELMVSILLFLLLLLLPVMSGCKQEIEKPIYVGVVLSATGVSSSLGEKEKRSLELIEEEINKKGGVSGQTIKFVILDDRSEPARASVAATKLARNKNIIGLIGGSTTGTTLAIKPIAEKYQIPLVSMGAGTSLTKPPSKWVFRVAPSNSLAIEKILDYLFSQLHVRRIAILHDRNAFGTEGADEIETKSESRDIKIVSRENYGGEDTDMTSQIRRIMDSSGQALIVWGTNPGCAHVAISAHKLGIGIPIIFSHGIANKEFIDIAGEASDGVCFPACKILDPGSIQNKKWREQVDLFSEKYMKKYGTQIDSFAAHGYDAGLIVLRALRKNRTSRAIFRDEIEKIKDIVGIDGIYNYDSKNHDGLSVENLAMFRIENGKWKAID
ncbi:MAG: ABC transporter substrate-binding protein [Actinomycetota bacterium]|nr:ABC transporter substrate-binding protein [Actinomycetota bacterium]